MNELQQLNQELVQFFVAYEPTSVEEALAGYEKVEALLEQGANPDAQDEQGVAVLITAARLNDVTLISKLLEYRADPTIKDNEGFSVAFIVYTNILMQDWGEEGNARYEEQRFYNFNRIVEAVLELHPTQRWELIGDIRENKFALNFFDDQNLVSLSEIFAGEELGLSFQAELARRNALSNEDDISPQSSFSPTAFGSSEAGQKSINALRGGKHH